MALYESSTWAWDGQIRNLQASDWYAQTFTPQTTHDITSVILSLGRPSGDSPGTITVTIREVEDSGPNINKPKDDVIYDLCSGTTNGNTLPETGFPTPTPEEREITFGVNPTLIAGTKYAIVVRALSGGASDLVRWSASTSSVYANGDQCMSSDSGSSWTLYSSRELWFKEYGDPSTPGKPTGPAPSDTATNITLDQTPLSWTAGANTDTFDIYFGVSGSEVLVASDQDVSDEDWTVDFGTLNYGITYGWRVDATSVYGTTTGDTWTFTALVFAPPSPSAGKWQIIKRLVAAAKNKFWYEDV